MNTGLRSNNTSGVTGVHFDKRKNKWIARISANGQRIILGEYDNFDDAKNKRVISEDEYHGEFSYYNSQCYT
jgi:hypothetical protein